MSPTPSQLATALLDGGEEPRGRRGARGRRATRRQRLARFVVARAVRLGGGLPAKVFDAAGELVAEQPLWHPAIVAVSDWRLSPAAEGLLGQLAEPADRPPEFGPEVRPRTVADALLTQGLSAELGRAGWTDWATALRRLCPFEDLAALDQPAPAETGGLAAILAADWFWPYAGDWLTRRWLTAESRLDGLDRPRQARLADRWQNVLDRLLAAWRERPEHLAHLARFYGRWLRARQGVRGVLRVVRAGAAGSVKEREEHERRFGRLLAPALALAELARELRGYGWQRTAAEAYYLGAYARHCEPHLGELRQLHDELCRLV